MRSSIEVKQIDQAEIDYLVRSLEKIEEDKAIKTGLNKAGQVFKVGGRQRLRQRMKSGSKGITGNLQNSFKVRVKRNHPGVLIGFEQGKGNHAHLVDRGTVERFQRKNNKSVGKMPANYFWTDTESMDNNKAIDRLYEGIEKAVQNINNRK